MQTFIAALAVFGIAVVVMSLGVIVQGKRLRGSCGGTGENCHCSSVGAYSCDTRKARRAGHSVS
jgi:hypothetical protein